MSKISPHKNGTHVKLAEVQQDAIAAAPVAQTCESESVQVGARIRMIRKQQGLTIRTLAEQCQISPNTLSLIEYDRTSPSLRTLGQLAQGLGVNVGTFLEPEVAGQGVVYQQQGQRMVTRFANGTIENLGDGLPPLGAEPILVTLETHPVKIEDVSHAGREFVYCIAGSVACFIGGTRYPLAVGDSLLFDASIPHHWENTHPLPSRLLVLFCPMDAHDHPVEQHLDH
jgi:transcriptional regulator with XRE-family HTH domain